jgi:hypothetical protein
LPSYRLYRFDGAGKINTAEWLEAADDDEAQALAHGRAQSGTHELWRGARLVARLAAIGRS